MDKRILKKIAKDWAKGILVSTNMDSEFADEVLSYEEQKYIYEEVEKIGERIIDGNTEASLDDIIKKHYDVE